MDAVFLQRLTEVLLQIDGINHLHWRGLSELHILDIQDFHLGLYIVMRVFAFLDDIVQRFDGGGIIMIGCGNSGQFVSENAFHFKSFVQ